MIALFERLSAALQAGPLAALAASAAWGVMSILLSPCHLSSIPLIVGFIDGQGIVTKRRAFALSGLFSLGILATISLIGVITGMMGRLLGDIGGAGSYFVAAVFVVIGLHLLEVITIPFLGVPNRPAMKRKGAIAALIIGLVFGVALGPCTFAFMAPMLGIAFKTAVARPWFAASLVFSYAVGHCSVIVVAGTSTSVVQRYLNWNARSKGAVMLKKACGVLVILGGVYLAWSAR
jgi:cytochrome c-type biogenesis protein